MRTETSQKGGAASPPLLGFARLLSSHRERTISSSYGARGYARGTPYDRVATGNDKATPSAHKGTTSDASVCSVISPVGSVSGVKSSEVMCVDHFTPVRDKTSHQVTGCAQ